MALRRFPGDIRIEREPGLHAVVDGVMEKLAAEGRQPDAEQTPMPIVPWQADADASIRKSVLDAPTAIWPGDADPGNAAGFDARIMADPYGLWHIAQNGPSGSYLAKATHQVQAPFEVQDPAKRQAALNERRAEEQSRYETGWAGWLLRQGDRANDAFRYYAGPHLSEGLGRLTELLRGFTPVHSQHDSARVLVEQAPDAAQRALDAYRRGDAWGVATPTLEMLLAAAGMLPGGPKGNFGRFSYPTPKENIAQGRLGVVTVMRERNSVPAAMWREDIGPVTFDYGVAGDPSREFRGGWGISHILAKRSQEGMDAERFVRESLPNAIAFGRLQRIYGPSDARRAEIVHGDTVVKLSLYRYGDRETWLITGFDRLPE